MKIKTTQYVINTRLYFISLRLFLCVRLSLRFTPIKTRDSPNAHVFHRDKYWSWPQCSKTF
jgi:hypothetical protein